METIGRGDTVRITVHAGLLAHPDDTRFSGECQPGTLGEYLGWRPMMNGLLGWHIIKVGNLYAPLQGSQFEVAR